eukprot:764145-Hanusia_phi.AAC.2
MRAGRDDESMAEDVIHSLMSRFPVVVENTFVQVIQYSPFYSSLQLEIGFTGSGETFSIFFDHDHLESLFRSRSSGDLFRSRSSGEITIIWREINDRFYLTYIIILDGDGLVELRTEEFPIVFKCTR